MTIQTAIQTRPTASPAVISRVAILGCGAMGAALIRGLLRAKSAPKIRALDPHLDLARTRLGEHAALVTDQLVNMVAFKPDLIILAVKPQSMLAASAQFATLSRNRWMVSLAAGVKTAELRNLFPHARGVTRAIPNMAATHGQGMMVMVGAPGDDEAQLKAIEALFAPTGKVARVRSDAELDVATALSGSGPAYFFSMAEAMARAGERFGLDADLARQLAAQTLAGAGALASDFDAVVALKRAVQSPGGTTAAALSVLEGPKGIDEAVDGSVAAAVTRARELSR